MVMPQGDLKAGRQNKFDEDFDSFLRNLHECGDDIDKIRKLALPLALAEEAQKKAAKEAKGVTNAQAWIDSDEEEHQANPMAAESEDEPECLSGLPLALLSTVTIATIFYLTTQQNI